MTTVATQIVEKEDIPSLDLSVKSKIESPEALKKIRKDLERAMALGNLHHGKTRILFRDAEGVKEVHTTVWAVGDRNISLKGGVILPLANIVEVKL